MKKIYTINCILGRLNLKELQTNDTYCRYLKQSLHISSVNNIFKLDNDTLYGQTHDADKSIKVLIVPRFLIPIILINSHNLQEYAGKTKSYRLIKREFFWTGMGRDIDKFIHNCNRCKQNDLQKLS